MTASVRLLRVYVAGSSQEIPRVQRATRRIVAAGHTLTTDWTTAILTRGLGGDANRGVPPVVRARESRNCLDAIARADLVLLLAPEMRSAGCWVELGYALAEKRLRPDLLVMSCGDVAQSIFCQLTHSFRDDEAALRWLEHVAAAATPIEAAR